MNSKISVPLLLPAFKCAFVLCVLLFTACSKPVDFHYLNGKTGNFEGLKGQWTVINYWATWCKPCIKEIPELNALAAKHENIKVLGINFDHLEQAELAVQAGKLGIHFDNIVVSNGVDPFMTHFGYAKPTALPTTVIISPNLTIKAVLMGPQDEATLSSMIAAHSVN